MRHNITSARIQNNTQRITVSTFDIYLLCAVVNKILDLYVVINRTNTIGETLGILFMIVCLSLKSYKNINCSIIKSFGSILTFTESVVEFQ